MAGSTLAEAIKYLKKETSRALEFDHKLEAISTGSIAIDRTIGIGGFPVGRVSEVFGWEGSAKTTLCVAACAAAQRAGKYVAYVDAERGLDLAHASRIGFKWDDIEKSMYATPFSMEENFEIIHAMADTGSCPLIIADSVASMVPKKELEGDIDDMGGIGLRSRMLAQFLARITKTITEKKVALVLVNQMRKKINTEWADRFAKKEDSAGGSALKHYTSLRIDLSKGKSITEKFIDPLTNKEEEKVIGNVHHCEIIKNKVAMPYRECEFFVKFDERRNIFGIDNLMTILEAAKGQNIITSKGAGFYTVSVDGTSVSLRGYDEVYDFFMKPENNALRLAVRAKVGL